MLYIFICEDEEVQLNYIKSMITEYIVSRGIDAQIAAAEKEPEGILAKLHDVRQPSVFFIDVQLEGCDMDGFELAGRLKRLNSEYGIVFLTSNAHMAYKAFEYRLEVLDYIVKEPGYFLRETISGQLEERLDVIFEKAAGLCGGRDRKTIALSCGSKVTEVIVEDIILIQSVAGKHLTDVILRDHMITVRETLKSLYGRLGGDFIYVNKSCVVNRYKMKELDKKERFLYLDGGFRVEAAYREIKRVEGILKSINIS